MSAMDRQSHDKLLPKWFVSLWSWVTFKTTTSSFFHSESFFQTAESKSSLEHHNCWCVVDHSSFGIECETGREVSNHDTMLDFFVFCIWLQDICANSWNIHNIVKEALPTPLAQRIPTILLVCIRLHLFLIYTKIPTEFEINWWISLIWGRTRWWISSV